MLSASDGCESERCEAYSDLVHESLLLPNLSNCHTANWAPASFRYLLITGGKCAAPIGATADAIRCGPVVARPYWPASSISSTWCPTSRRKSSSAIGLVI